MDECDFKFDTSKYTKIEGHNDIHKDRTMQLFREVLVSSTDYVPEQYHKGDSYENIRDDIITFINTQCYIKII